MLFWRGYSHISTLPTKLHGNICQIRGAVEFVEFGGKQKSQSWAERTNIIISI
jgi:hypothetical protein